MKNIVVYAAVAFVTTLVSAWAFHQFSGRVDHDRIVEDSRGFDQDDLRAAADDAFDDYVSAKLAKADSPEALYAARLDESIGALRGDLKEALAKLDRVASGEVAPGEVAYEIPNADQLENLVSQALVKEQERTDRERQERRDAQMKERTDRAKQRTLDTLKERLNLSGEQVAKVEVVLDEANAARAEAGRMMRDARDSGADFDWTQMRTQFEDMNKKMDASVMGLLSGEQQTLYEKYKEENPMALFGGGFGGRGGRGGFGARPGGNGGDAGAGAGGGGRRRRGN
ncbi:MAG: hypothetical protein R3F20_06165 [Planctomycetota bacterium]